MRTFMLAVLMLFACLPAAAETLPVSAADTLTVEFLDVGQADAILITMPHGGRYLVDAGVRDTQVLALLQARGITHLDGMLLTHPHTDHCGGMPAILRTLTVDTFYESGKLHTAPSYRDTLRAALESGAGYATVRRGDTLAWDPDVLIEVLHPDTPAYRDINTNSVVLRLTCRGTRVLLTGDATKRSEEIMLAALPAKMLRADVLKVAHHGSRGSNTAVFLAAVAPDTYVIMCARENSYGHPHPQTLERLTAQGGAVFSTALDGTVMLMIGDTVAIAGERLRAVPAAEVPHATE